MTTLEIYDLTCWHPKSVMILIDALLPIPDTSSCSLFTVGVQRLVKIAITGEYHELSPVILRTPPPKLQPSVKFFPHFEPPSTTMDSSNTADTAQYLSLHAKYVGIHSANIISSQYSGMRYSL